MQVKESVKAQVRVVHDANTIDARVGQLVDPIDGAQDGDDKVNERNDQPDQVGAEHLAPRVLVDGRDALAAPAHGWAELAARVHARTPVAAAEVEHEEEERGRHEHGDRNAVLHELVAGRHLVRVALAGE